LTSVGIAHEVHIGVAAARLAGPVMNQVDADLIEDLLFRRGVAVVGQHHRERGLLAGQVVLLVIPRHVDGDRGGSGGRRGGRGGVREDGPARQRVWAVGRSPGALGPAWVLRSDSAWPWALETAMGLGWPSRSECHSGEAWAAVRPLQPRQRWTCAAGAATSPR